MKIYLACPYFHKDPNIINERVKYADKKAAELMMQGYIVFSPLSHTHPISKFVNIDPCDHDFYLKQDLPFVEWCDELWVYQLLRWEESKGIKREIKYAEHLGKIVRYIK